MKNKIHPIAKRENTKESLIKFQILSEKLGKHFNNRLRPLLEEKNYKYSQLLLDIKSFFRQMEEINLETDQIVPKMEKYLIDILSRQVNNRYDNFDTYETNNTNDTNKTDEPVGNTRKINRI
mgnify:CR=1 FL=1